MKEEFIPWPDYVICPNCNEKVKLPKNWGLNIKPSKKVIKCPYCKTSISYVQPGIIDPSLLTK